MDNYCMLYEKIKYICNYNYGFFLSNPNVVGVGIGCKEKCGCCTGQMCITVFVRQKLPSYEIPILSLIPPVYMGVPTDVIESGSISLDTCNCSCSNSVLHERKRPCVGGYSIGVAGHPDCTMGCLVKDNAGNSYILTSNHATAANSMAAVGHAILTQPAPKYGGKSPRDNVATVSQVEYIDLTGKNNFVDAAICESNPSMITSGLYDIGKIRGTLPPRIGMKVLKVGSGSDKTTGTIKSLASVMKIDFLGHEVLFKDQIITDPMSKPGDEGALLVNKSESKAIGLLMTATYGITVYNNITQVLKSLNVHIG